MTDTFPVVGKKCVMGKRHKCHCKSVEIESLGDDTTKCLVTGKSLLNITFFDSILLKTYTAVSG